MSKKILIVTEKWAGSGHWMAAVALRQALLEHYANQSVSIVDGLQTVSPILQKLSRASYFSAIRHVPFAWEWMYNNNRTWSMTLKKPLSKWLAHRVAQKVLQREQPDAVIATHAYCLAALAEAKKTAVKPFILGCVLTDYHVNSFWVHPGVDYYVVPHEQMAEELKRRHKVSNSKICIHGIPVRTEFAKNRHKSKAMWRQELGLRPQIFTVLICGGGAGYLDAVSLVQRLLLSGKPLQLIIVTGQNREQLQRLRLELMDKSAVHSLKLLGYVDNMNEWLGAADLVITKPGGLTCAECLALGIPMVFYRPLPGQERKNSLFLQTKGAACEAATIEELVESVHLLQSNRDLWKKLADRSSSLGVPNSSYHTAEFFVSRVEKINMNAPVTQETY